MPTIPDLRSLSPFERRVSGVLGRFGLAQGIYDETEDAQEWLARESIDVAHSLDVGMCPSAVLYDTGFWTENKGPFPAELLADLDRIREETQ